MPVYQSYLRWKWKELAPRRVFYIVLLQFILTFMWLNLYVVVNESNYFGKRSEQILSPLPLIVCIFHGLAFLMLSSTEKGKKLMRDTQGKYVCYWSAISLFTIELLHMMTCYYEINDRTSNQSAVAFAVVSIIGVQLFNQAGMSSMFLSTCKFMLMAWWILFFVLMLNYSTILVVVACIFALHSIAALKELEFFDAFERIKSTSMTAGELMEDTMFATDIINRALEHCRIVLHPHLNAQFQAAKARRNVDASAIAALHRTLQEELQNTPLRDQKHAILAEGQFLCRALHVALGSGDGSEPEPDEKKKKSAYSQFNFLDVCTSIIRTLELAVGGGLPIYVAESSLKVSITGPQAILEVIILLLLYEAAHSSPGICVLSCDHNAGEGWRLKVQTTTSMDGLDSNVNASVRYRGDDREGSQLIQRRAPKAINHRWLQLKNFLDAKNSEKVRSCLERLADHISRKALQEPVVESEPEIREGYKISYRSITLKTDVFSCTVVYGNTNTVGVTTAGRHSSNSIGSALITPQEPLHEVALADEEQALLLEADDITPPPPKLSDLPVHIDSWVFLVPRMQDANDLLDIKSKIDLLAIPTMGHLAVLELNKKNYVYNYAVISESYLKSLGKQQCGMINGKIKQLVVAHEMVSNEEYFFFEYGVRVAQMLPLHGSGLKQVFDCVQSVAKKRGPRALDSVGDQRQIDAKPAEDIREHVQRWIALLGQFRDLGRLGSKDLDVLGTNMNTLDALQHITLSSVYGSVICKMVNMNNPSSFSRGGRKYLQQMDRVVANLRTALQRRSLGEMMTILSDASRDMYLVDIQPMHYFLKSFLQIIKLCAGSEHDEVASDVRPFHSSPRAVVDIGDPAVLNILMPMVDLLDSCAWDVILSKAVDD